MALTVAHDAEAPGKGGVRPPLMFGPRPVAFWTGTIAFDSSYATGGESLDFTSAGLDMFRTVLGVLVETKSGYLFEYDYTNKKVKAYRFDYDAVADGAAIEVANTTDLSAVTGVRVFAWGYR